MPPGPVIAGPAWLSPPDGTLRVQPEEKITIATNTTRATMPSDAAARLSPLGRCPRGGVAPAAISATTPRPRGISYVSPQGPGCRGSHITSQIRDRWIVSRIDRAREETDVGTRARVHPYRGSGKACVAEAADGKDHASRSGIGGIDIPAEATQVLSPHRRIVRSEQRIVCVWCLRDGFSGGIVGCLDLLSGMSGLRRTSDQLQRRVRE